MQRNVLEKGTWNSPTQHGDLRRIIDKGILHQLTLSVLQFIVSNVRDTYAISLLGTHLWRDAQTHINSSPPSAAYACMRQ